MSELLGNTTGSFNEDGELTDYSGSGGIDSKPNLKFPAFRLSYITTVGRGMSSHAGIGANETIFSASFNLVDKQQDYDLQDLIYTASLDSGSDFFNQVGKRAIVVQRVYYKSPIAMWNFFGGNAIGAVGNMSTYGMYADDSNFQLVPAWQNILQAYAFEEDMNVRASHYSFRINNNNMRIFPCPDGQYPNKMWIDFKPARDAFTEEDDRKYGADGVNNLNTLPFPNVPYKNINSIGKQWIRRFSLSLAN